MPMDGLQARWKNALERNQLRREAYQQVQQFQTRLRTATEGGSLTAGKARQLQEAGEHLLNLCNQLQQLDHQPERRQALEGLKQETRRLQGRLQGLETSADTGVWGQNSPLAGLHTLSQIGQRIQRHLHDLSPRETTRESQQPGGRTR